MGFQSGFKLVALKSKAGNNQYISENPYISKAITQAFKQKSGKQMYINTCKRLGFYYTSTIRIYHIYHNQKRKEFY
jgi:hypothetical protein